MSFTEHISGRKDGARRPGTSSRPGGGFPRALHSLAAAVIVSITASAVAVAFGAAPASADPLSSMVRVEVSRNGVEKVGSGFIVARKGAVAFVVTAAHVVAGGGDRVQVSFYNDRHRDYRADTVGMDEHIDLAVLKIWGVSPHLPALALGSEAGIRPGRSLELIGYPLRDAKPFRLFAPLTGRRDHVWRLNRPVQEGNSGGPVIHEGAVVGVITRSEHEWTDAVTVDSLRSFLDEQRVEATGRVAPPPAVHRPAPERAGNGKAVRLPCNGLIPRGRGYSPKVYSLPQTRADSWVIPEGSRLRIVDATTSGKQWWRIEKDGRRGWVPAGSIEFLSDCYR